jgi:hypothetical protein
MRNEQDDSGASGSDEVADAPALPLDETTALPEPEDLDAELDAEHAGPMVVHASGAAASAPAEASASPMDAVGCGTIAPAINVLQWFPAKRIIIEVQATSWVDLEDMLVELKAGYDKQNGIPAGTAMTVERNGSESRQFAQVLGRPE